MDIQKKAAVFTKNHQSDSRPSLVGLIASYIWLASICCAVVISPFAVWPYALVQFELPRVIFWQGVSITSMLLSLFILATQEKHKYRLNKKVWLTLFFWLVSIIVSVWSNNSWSDSWAGNFYRLDGLQTLAAMVCLSLAVGLGWRAGWQRLVAVAQVCAATIIALWTLLDTARLWQGAAGLIPNMNGAVGVSFGQPNFLAGYLLITLPWLYFLWNDSTSKIIRALLSWAGIVSCVAIVATQSWATVLGIGLFGVGLVCAHWRRTKYLVVLALLCAVAFNGYAYWEGHTTFYPESRARIFYRSYLAVIEKPYFGWGWARVDEAISTYPWPAPVLYDVYIDKAHSHFLEMALTTGALGLGAYLIFISALTTSLNNYLTDAKANRHWYSTLLLILMLYTFHTQTNVIGIAEEIPFWFLVGWMLFA